MTRLPFLLFALVAPAVVAVACHSSSSTTSDDDSGSDACAPCKATSDAGTSVLVACGKNACGSGIPALCTNEGALIPYENCAAGDAASSCTPTCGVSQCGVPDMCGGTCGCPSGVECVNQVCGNGCNVRVSQPCTSNDDEGGPESCCAMGASCRLTGGGSCGNGPCCCALTDGAECITSTDCCDYPTATCVMSPADGGGTVGRCTI